MNTIKMTETIAITELIADTDTDTITILPHQPGPRLASRGAMRWSTGICRNTPTIRRSGWR